MTEPSGLRARKKLETRRRIEAVALDLFARDGFDATTVEAIAAAAAISPRTFFHYFPTKEDVVLADYADRLTRITDLLGARPPSEPAWSALRAAFLVVSADYETERPGLIRRFRIMAATPSVSARSLQLQADWENRLAEVIARRASARPDGDIDARLLASAALAAMRSSLRHWLATEGSEPLPSLVEGCFARLAAGLADHP
ncbi:MAG: TetR family transcriptional regulator [Thermoleophilia bacterium]